MASFSEAIIANMTANMPTKDDKIAQQFMDDHSKMAEQQLVLAKKETVLEISAALKSEESSPNPNTSVVEAYKRLLKQATDI